MTPAQIVQAFQLGRASATAARRPNLLQQMPRLNPSQTALPPPEPDYPPVRVESVSELSPRQRLVYTGLVAGWIIVNLVFWTWWLNPAHVQSVWFYVIFTVSFFYTVTFLPSMYLYYLGRMRRPKPIEAPPGLRVAMITLCVPSSETIDVISRQMEALTKVRYPHDSWVLDEGNDPRVRAEAERLGVHYFTRKGVGRYNQPSPPFKAKTKAGNVNAWLDAHGKDYDFFVQLDIDHEPETDYLDRTLGFFRDPQVGWVQGPSLYGNLDESWIARGSAEQELVLQGPLQRGFYGASETPFIIGSHCTYRTDAILEIGGFQPTRAEDHLDTVMLAALGYRGVFVPDVLAVGDGPGTFETYLRQQFAWAFSMMEVLFTFTPRLVWTYKPVQAIQFLFAQTWYVLWSTSCLILFITPLLGLITGNHLASVRLFSFIGYWIPIDIFALVIWIWSRRWQMPKGLSLSWRGVVLHVARWPIVFWAFINVALRVKHPYMITPKGEADGLPRFSVRTQMLYLAAIWITAVVTWVYLGKGMGFFLDLNLSTRAINSMGGFLLLALWGCVFMIAVVLANIIADNLELRRRGVGFFRRLRLRTVPLATIGASILILAFTAFQGRDLMVEAVTWEPDSAVSALEAQNNADFQRARETLSLEAARSAWSTSASSLVPVPRVEPTVEAAPAVDAAPPAPRRQDLYTIEALPLPESGVVAGAYDPWDALESLPIRLEHWYVHQDEARLLAGALAHARNKRTVMVTVEPFLWSGDRTNVLDRIVTGEADDDIRDLARVVRASQPQEVLIRWGHEMELQVLYPWAARDPELYIAAFRHVVDIFRQEGATNVRFVWSPAGNVEAQAYYPGDEYVDYIGLTVLGDADWDALFGKTPQSFAQILRPRYEWAKQYDKPMIVAEVGVSGSQERQETWLREAAESLVDFPLVRAVVYFNAVNATNNRLEVQPDWRVDADIYRELTETLPSVGSKSAG